MSEPILTVADLRVSYGRVEAVRGVSFEAGQGSLVTLVGANGAGKSSVINAVSGMLRPAGGRITFQGRDVTRTPAHKLVAQGLVQVPEGRQILATLTIEENLLMGAWHTGARPSRPWTRCTTASRSWPSGVPSRPGRSPAVSSRCWP